MTGKPALFATQSLLIAGDIPESTSLRHSSRDLGWSSILVDEFETVGDREEAYETDTPDVIISVGIEGVWDLWAMNDGRWASAVLHAGSVNLGAAGQACQMRWRNRNANLSFRTAVAYMPPITLEETADFFRRPGQRLEHLIPSKLVINDQAIASTVTAMVEASVQGAGDLYGEQASRWLATHLVHAHGQAFDPEADSRKVGSITDVRLARVIEYMRANLAQQMTITELANVAAVSPFHFCRVFSTAVGMSPHRYLVDRRMQKAEALLRTTDISLNEIAAECGYVRANAFSIAFQRRYGVTPTIYRRTSR